MGDGRRRASFIACYAVKWRWQLRVRRLIWSLRYGDALAIRSIDIFIETFFFFLDVIKQAVLMWSLSNGIIFLQWHIYLRWLRDGLKHIIPYYRRVAVKAYEFGKQCVSRRTKMSCRFALLVNNRHVKFRNCNSMTSIKAVDDRPKQRNRC